MKQQLHCNEVNSINEIIIGELYSVESLVETTLESCLRKECDAQYYEGEDISSKISEERNTYINMLEIALEKIKNIQKLNGEIETMIIASTVKSLQQSKKTIS